MTAEEFFDQKYGGREKGILHDEIRAIVTTFATAFARMKCKEQREICAMEAELDFESTPVGTYDYDQPKIDGDSIRNAPEPELLKGD